MEKSNENYEFSATEGKAPVAFSEWTQKLRFDRSFTAKLILSDEKIKEFYADIATALLRYEKVKSHTGWSGVSFLLGRERIAYISIIGKTLCVYLAVSPEEEGRYKAKDVSSVKARVKTPSLYKVKSNGAKNYVIARIEELASRENFVFRQDGEASVSLAAFKTDSFNNLITRGLIRIAKNGLAGGLRASVATARRNGAYEDTVETVNALTERHGVYNEILTVLAEGEGKAKLSKKKMLRSVDEMWVKAIEDCISALDELIRNPNHYIAESEDILPIEKTKRVSGRSIAHLCRHTDYLSVGRDGEMTPVKMLNVFREDSLLTYENKFLNTLINRLYSFVSARYKVAKEYGADETLESFEFESNFAHGDGKGRIKISVEYSERNLNSDVKNALTGTGLWQRVERLFDIVTGYVNSSFAKAMERNFVRPPILRTNAVLKNKYFRECLALWEFIESYDDAGYGIAVEEVDEALSDEYVKGVYSGAAMQYLAFRHEIDGALSEDVDAFDVKPDFVLSEFDGEDFSEELVCEVENAELDDDLTFALQVALMTDEVTGDEGEVAETFIQKTFQAKLRSADEVLKEYFAEIVNCFIGYDGVKIRHSRKCATVYRGRKTFAKITVNGKILKAYFALDAEELPKKYNATDVSDKKFFADTPVCLKVKSKRGLKYAKEAIALLAEKNGLIAAKYETEKVNASDYAAEPLADLLQKGWATFVKKKPFDGDGLRGVGFGSRVKGESGKFAEQADRLAVTESKSVRYKPRNTTSDAEGATDEGLRLAKEIAGLIRPSGNYEKPTDYGLDDVSGFITDDNAHKVNGDE